MKISLAEINIAYLHNLADINSEKYKYILLIRTIIYRHESQEQLSLEGLVGDVLGQIDKMNANKLAGLMIYTLDCQGNQI